MWHGGCRKDHAAAALAREFAQHAPVFWHTFSVGVSTSLEMLIRQLALFLLSLGRAQAASLLQPRSQYQQALSYEQQLHLIAAGLNDDQSTPLLCFDNLHLVAHDAPLLNMLNYLSGTTTAALLLTSREQIPLLQVATMSLAGLNPAEGLELIKQLGGAWEQTAAERLAQKTGGNPMLLRLAVGQLRDESAAPAERERLIDRLESQPQVASYLLDSVLLHLEAPAWQLLSLLSIIRHPVDLHDELLVELSQAADGACDFNAAVESLQRRYLIEHAGVAKLHPLIHDHVYTMLAATTARRRRLHALVARWEERARGDGLEAAFHFSRAGRPERARAALAQQANTFIDSGQIDTAATLVDDVLAQVRRKRGDQSALLRQLLATRGYLLADTLRAAEAEAAYREALTLASQPSVRAQLTYRLASILLAACTACRGIITRAVRSRCPDRVRNAAARAVGDRRS